MEPSAYYCSEGMYDTHIHADALICAIERSCARLHVKEQALGVCAVIDVELVVSPPA